MKSFLWIAALAGLWAAQTFRSTVEAIVMDVSVLDRKGDPVRGLTIGDIAAEAAAPRVSAAGQANHAFLRSVSLNTGGFATLNTNDTDAAARGILQDPTAYYLIGFEPSGGARASRSVAVRVSRPGVTVRARPGYWMDGPR